MTSSILQRLDSAQKGIEPASSEARPTLGLNQNVSRKSVRRSTMKKSRKCPNCQEDMQLRSTLGEADKQFLESLIHSRELEIASLKEQLKVRDLEN